MATKPTPTFLDAPDLDDPTRDDIDRDDTSAVASDDTFADDTTRRAADETDGVADVPSGDDAPVLEDAAGADAEDVAAEAPLRRRRR